MDTVARIIGQRMGEILGQQIVVENVAGAGGMIGSLRVAQAAPDGYTVLYGGSAVLAQNQAIYKKPLVDGNKDFTFVSMFADQARVLVARKDFPAQDMKGFFDYVKANEAKISYGSAGAGSGSHVCPLIMDKINGTKVTHVPYRGSGHALQDLIAGRLDFMAEQVSTVAAQVEAGNIKAIAVLGTERVTSLPNLPTALEQGVQGLDCGSWQALLLPKGAPERNRPEARRSRGPDRRDAVGDRALHKDRRLGSREGASHAGLSGEVHPDRDRALGRDHQGCGHQRGLTAPMPLKAQAFLKFADALSQFTVFHHAAR